MARRYRSPAPRAPPRRGLVATDFGASFTGGPVAEAQQKKKDRPGVFERLFGPREAPPRKAAPPRASSPTKRRILPIRKKSGPTRNKPRQSTVAVVRSAQRTPTRKKILVIGDFVRRAIAWGLDQALRQGAEAVVHRAAPTDRPAWSAPTTTTGTRSSSASSTRRSPTSSSSSSASTTARSSATGEERHPVRSRLAGGLCPTHRRDGRYAQGLWPAVLLGRARRRSVARQRPRDIAYLNGLIEPRVARPAATSSTSGTASPMPAASTSPPAPTSTARSRRSAPATASTSPASASRSSPIYVEREIRRHDRRRRRHGRPRRLGLADQHHRDRPRRQEAPGRPGDLAFRPAPRRQRRARRRRRAGALRSDQRPGDRRRPKAAAPTWCRNRKPPGSGWWSRAKRCPVSPAGSTTSPGRRRSAPHQACRLVAGRRLRGRHPSWRPPRPACEASGARAASKPN